MKNLLFGALTLTISVAVFVQTGARRAETDVEEIQKMTDRIIKVRVYALMAHKYHTLRAFSETTSSLAATHDLAYSNDQTSTSAQDDGPGFCYRDDLDVPEEEREKNNWQTPCACVEITACDPKNGESSSCKRHCKKNQCDCCAV